VAGGGCQQKVAAGAVAPGGVRRRGSPEQPKLELPTTKIDGKRFKTKLERNATHLGACRGGRGARGGDRGGAAELRRLPWGGSAARVGKGGGAARGEEEALGHLL
jgi:hypothetical protein